MTVYVGARDIEVLGEADVSVSYSGFQFWVDQIANRNTANGFQPWGGSITFNSGVSWYFDDDLETLEAFPGKYDFFSIAVHELGHLMGMGTGSRAYMARVSNNTFQGAHAVALFGGPVPLSAPDDLEHWASTLRFDGQIAAMITSITSNQRASFTELDFAVLRDVGHTITPAPPVIDLVPQWMGLPERVEMDEDTATSLSVEDSDQAIVGRSFILTVSPVTIHLDIIRVEDGSIVSWRGNGILQVANRVEGPYRDLLDASSPLKVNDDRSQFYRMLRP